MDLKVIMWIPAKEKGITAKVLDIPEESFAILIQNKKAAVVKYYHPTYDEPWGSFLHPKNESELDKELTNIITKENPEFLNEENAVIYNCPKEWSDKAIWDAI